MGLRPIQPGLRTIFHNAIDVSKVSLSVPAGETLVVSDDIAEQLLAAAPQFKDVTEAPTPEPEPAATDEADAKPKRSRKS